MTEFVGKWTSAVLGLALSGSLAWAVTAAEEEPLDKGGPSHAAPNAVRPAPAPVRPAPAPARPVRVPVVHTPQPVRVSAPQPAPTVNTVRTTPAPRPAPVAIRPAPAPVRHSTQAPRPAPAPVHHGTHTPAVTVHCPPALTPHVTTAPLSHGTHHLGHANGMATHPGQQAPHTVANAGPHHLHGSGPHPLTGSAALLHTAALPGVGPTFGTRAFATVRKPMDNPTKPHTGFSAQLSGQVGPLSANWGTAGSGVGYEAQHGSVSSDGSDLSFGISGTVPVAGLFGISGGVDVGPDLTTMCVGPSVGAGAGEDAVSASAQVCYTTPYGYQPVVDTTSCWWDSLVDAAASYFEPILAPLGDPASVADPFVDH